MKRVFSLLLALMLIFSLTISAFASGGEVTYRSKKSIVIAPATKVYTDTDLFGNFKNVMPGDSLADEVKITNLAVDSDYVKVYIQAIPHGVNNPLSPSVAEQETIASMKDFLSQLNMQVWDGEKRIYNASPDETAQLSDRVYLGSLRRFKSMTLDVELRIPITLGNKYADRIGEVDWVITFEAFDDPSENPKTGDYIMIAVAVMAVSALALVVLFAAKKRKKK